MSAGSSLARKLRYPAFGTRTDALGEVGSDAQPLLFGALKLHRLAYLLDQPLPERGPDGAHGQRPRCRQLAGEAESLRLQVAFVHHGITEAQCVSFLAPYTAPGQQEVLRSLVPN